MKIHYVITLLLALILIMQGLQAKVIIVNNNDGHPTDIENFYDDLQEAIDAAISGEDTIYLVGSPTTYGSSITINKQLTLIGPGYFLVENKNVEDDAIQTQANLETAKINYITIEEDGDGTVITGIDMGNLINNRITINENCHNTELTRNRLYNLTISGESTLVRENFIRGTATIFTGSSNTVIRNNIIMGVLIWHINTQGVSGIEIINNTLNSGLNNIQNNTNIDNNIFINDEPLLYCTNNTFRNNVFTVSESDVFTGDQNNNNREGDEYSAARDKLFIASPQEIDRDYKLAENSPAKEVGPNKIVAGAYTSDASSYKRSGLPAVPAIYDYTIHDGVGTAEKGITVTIKAKSHN